MAEVGLPPQDVLEQELEELLRCAFPPVGQCPHAKRRPPAADSFAAVFFLLHESSVPKRARER